MFFFYCEGYPNSPAFEDGMNFYQNKANFELFCAWRGCGTVV
jgi:hypothetical protein